MGVFGLFTVTWLAATFYSGIHEVVVGLKLTR